MSTRARMARASSRLPASPWLFGHPLPVLWYNAPELRSESLYAPSARPPLQGATNPERTYGPRD
jgi:hypothetical protein